MCVRERLQVVEKEVFELIDRSIFGIFESRAMRPYLVGNDAVLMCTTIHSSFQSFIVSIDTKKGGMGKGRGGTK